MESDRRICGTNSFLIAGSRERLGFLQSSFAIDLFRPEPAARDILEIEEPAAARILYLETPAIRDGLVLDNPDCHPVILDQAGEIG